jgi:hypothetical protein
MMIVHTVSLGPLMLDYDALNEHRDETFDKWTLDGDYAHSNFGHFDLTNEIDYVDDSDRFKILSLTPRNEEGPPRVPVRGSGIIRDLNKGRHLWRVYTDPATDPLKKRLYLRRVVIHENDLGKEFERLAARDRKILDRFVVAAITDDDILAYDGRYQGLNSARRMNRAHAAYGRLLARTVHRMADFNDRRAQLFARWEVTRQHFASQGPARVRYYCHRIGSRAVQTVLKACRGSKHV